MCNDDTKAMQIGISILLSFAVFKLRLSDDVIILLFILVLFKKFKSK
jgi:hypothetical protein